MHCLTSEGPLRSFWRDAHGTCAIRRVQRGAADPDREDVEIGEEFLRGGGFWFVLKDGTSCPSGQEAGGTAQSRDIGKSLAVCEKYITTS